jgi:ferredoxin
VEAIYAEEDVPENQKEFIEINSQLSKVWPSITRAESHLDDADEWADVTEKKQHLER